MDRDHGNDGDRKGVEIFQEKILYNKYYESVKKFREAAIEFFSSIRNVHEITPGPFISD